MTMGLRKPKQWPTGICMGLVAWSNDRRLREVKAGVRVSGQIHNLPDAGREGEKPTSRLRRTFPRRPSTTPAELPIMRSFYVKKSDAELHGNLVGRKRDNAIHIEHAPQGHR